jgi:hypothetical protein
MRFVAVIICLMLSVCASSQALAGYEESKTWFERLSEDERYAVHISLTLQGHYNAFVDGLFGPSTFRLSKRTSEAKGNKKAGS